MPLTQEEIDACRETFQAFDTDRSCVVSTVCHVRSGEKADWSLWAEGRSTCGSCGKSWRVRSVCLHAHSLPDESLRGVHANFFSYGPSTH